MVTEKIISYSMCTPFYGVTSKADHKSAIPKANHHYIDLSINTLTLSRSLHQSSREPKGWKPRPCCCYYLQLFLTILLPLSCVLLDIVHHRCQWGSFVSAAAAAGMCWTRTKQLPPPATMHGSNEILKRLILLCKIVWLDQVKSWFMIPRWEMGHRENQLVPLAVRVVVD